MYSDRLYVLKVFHPIHGVRRIELAAESVTQAKTGASAQGYEVLGVVTTKHTAAAGRFRLDLFAQELLALLEAGLPLLECVEALEGRTPSKRGSIYRNLSAQLKEGRSLSAALARWPTHFPDLFVALIRASERTSDLANALRRFLAYHAQWQAARRKVAAALIYPALLLLVGLSVALFLLFYVIPRFSGVYQDPGADLPWASRMLFEWGQFLREHAGGVTGTLLGLCGVAIVGFAWWRRSGMPGARLIERMPGLGPQVATFRSARLHHTLAMLLRGGLTVMEALLLARDVAGAGQGGALDAARGQIEQGQSLAESLRDHGLADDIAFRLLRAGEQAADLGTAFERAATLADLQAGFWLEAFLRVFEPALMALLGLVIGGLVVLIYLPIFELASSVR